jgi:serine/threonine-protein kinase
MSIHPKTACVPQPGEIVAGKYAVDRLMTPGGMGIVAEARHLELGTRVAIKFLLDDGHQNPELVQRFIREARATSELTGQHVVRVHDVGRLESGAPYMVMEYLSGIDLKEELGRRGPMPWAEAVDFVLQACEGLAEAHARGIVHRDIKPSNLFLTRHPDGSPLIKVLDFGISKVEGAEFDHSLTATTEVIGSPQYMSPEQVRAARMVDARTDIWSLGVLLYELVSDEAPFSAETLSAISAMIVADPPVPLSTYCRDLPSGFEAVVMRCLEKDRDRRFHSVAELAAALGPYASSRGKLSAERAMRISRDSLTGLLDLTLKSRLLPAGPFAAPGEGRRRAPMASDADASGEATTVASSDGVAAKSDDSKVSTLAATEGAARKPTAHARAWWVLLALLGPLCLALVYFVNQRVLPSTQSTGAAYPPPATSVAPAQSSRVSKNPAAVDSLTVLPVAVPSRQEPSKTEAPPSTPAARKNVIRASKPPTKTTAAKKPAPIVPPAASATPATTQRPAIVDPLGDRK